MTKPSKRWKIKRQHLKKEVDWYRTISQFSRKDTNQTKEEVRKYVLVQPFTHSIFENNRTQKMSHRFAKPSLYLHSTQLLLRMQEDVIAAQSFERSCWLAWTFHEKYPNMMLLLWCLVKKLVMLNEKKHTKKNNTMPSDNSSHLPTSVREFLQKDVGVPGHVWTIYMRYDSKIDRDDERSSRI